MENLAADILIIGAGTAGCVLANRLSADPACQVLLVEAGGADDNPQIADPLAWPMLQGSAQDWCYTTEPQTGLGGRTLPYPRGKVLGGSSAINAMGHQRGDRRIFDAWEAAGNPGWGAAGLLPYFKASEHFSGGADAWRGDAGPLGVVRPEGGARHPQSVALHAAAIGAGHAANPDYNGAEMTGAAFAQYAMQDGKRHSAAAAYLHPVRARPNLRVLTGAQILGLRFAGDACCGAMFAGAGRSVSIAADRVVLCAGAVDTPRLLLLAGIGPAAELRALGIAPRHDAPELGANLADHPLLSGLVMPSPRPLPRSHFTGSEVFVFAASGAMGPIADLQILGITAPVSVADPRPMPEHGFTLVPCLVGTQSRGSIRLASADPLAPARIDPAYLAHPADVVAFRTAMRLAREIAARPELAEWNLGEILPGPGCSSDDDLDAYARQCITPFFHPVGTCRMGSDPRAVVDPQLRVHGARGLFVADASIMPQIPNAMTNAAVLAIAEKAGDLLGSKR